MKSEAKNKLKRRGQELYNKYFFNSDDIINDIIKQYDLGLPIETYVVKFDLDISYKTQIYELIMYYPNKIKELKNINEKVIKELYNTYGDTINIMKENIGVDNIRAKLHRSVSNRSKQYNIFCDLKTEDIILSKECPIFKTPLEYGNSICTKYSASLDRINPNLGYTKTNIQVVSMLANQMKSNANPKELIVFAKRILEIYDVPV